MIMEGQETKLCKHCQTEISKKAKVCPNCRKKQSGKGKWVIVALVALFLFGLFGGSSDTKKELLPKEERAYVSETEIENVYANPDAYKDKYIKLAGIVFGEPDIDNDVTYFQMYADAKNYEKNTVVVFYGNIDISAEDYVLIDGVITGSTSYQNMMGATITTLKIVTDSIEKSNYIDCCSPTIKTMDVNKTIEQKGYTVTLEKVEFSETETRLYISVNNSGSDNFSLSDYNIKVVQNGKQYENQYNYDAEYPSLQTDLIPGTTTSGVVSFPPLDTEVGLKIYCDAYCDDWSVDLEEYIFEF